VPGRPPIAWAPFSKSAQDIPGYTSHLQRFSAKTAQKSHVKPQPHLIHREKCRQIKQNQSPTHPKINPPKVKISYPQFDTIKE
jgi:hypothetical protein